jgi:hypothetical protein
VINAPAGAKFAYIAPFLKQAKSVAWGYLREACTGLAGTGVEINESELRIDFGLGRSVRLFGADNPEAIRGNHFHGVICDEYADWDPQVWPVILFPTLTSHKGWAVVTLFGGLSYVVELTMEFTEAESRSFSLFFDVASQKTSNPVVLFTEHEVIGRVLSPDTVFERPNAVDAQWYPIVEQFCKENGIELSRITPAAPATTTASSTCRSSAMAGSLVSGGSMRHSRSSRPEPASAASMRTEPDAVARHRHGNAPGRRRARQRARRPRPHRARRSRRREAVR